MQVISITMSEDLLEEIDKAGGAINRSEWVRDACEAKLDAETVGEQPLSESAETD